MIRHACAIFELSGSGGKPLLHVRPIDDLEDALHVVRSDVLVLEVVRVLPHVNAQQRHETGRGFEGVLHPAREGRAGRGLSLIHI